MSQSRLASLLFGLMLGAAGVAVASTETLAFKVYLDQSPIGEHRFDLAIGGSEKRVVSRAHFDVRLLIFDLYRYRHQSEEQWRDGCLERIQSATDDNGEAIRVLGERLKGALALEVNGERDQVPGCVGTFAYWSPDLLRRPRLLNPQNGELVEVRFEPLGLARRAFRGEEVEAQAYRLRAEDREIFLWYTADGDWIGLESDTGTGRVLRYERL